MFKSKSNSKDRFIYFTTLKLFITLKFIFKRNSKDDNGNRLEPIEEITVDVDEEFSSEIIRLNICNVELQPNICDV